MCIHIIIYIYICTYIYIYICIMCESPELRTALAECEEEQRRGDAGLAWAPAVWGLGFRVWGLGLLGFRVLGLRVSGQV